MSNEITATFKDDSLEVEGEGSLENIMVLIPTLVELALERVAELGDPEAMATTAASIIWVVSDQITETLGSDERPDLDSPSSEIH